MGGYCPQVKDTVCKVCMDIQKEWWQIMAHALPVRSSEHFLRDCICVAYYLSAVSSQLA